MNSMSVEQFGRDLKDETYFGTILDRELYIEQNGYTNLQRYKDLTNQHGGIDLSFTFDGREWHCDEKNSITCGLNLSTGNGRILRTFAFELFTTLNPADHDGRIGWFIDDKKITDSYMLFWNDRYTSKPRWNPVEYTYALVTKASVASYLESCGWPTDKLIKKKDQIVECWRNHNYVAEDYSLIKRSNGIYFHDEVCSRRFNDKRCYFSPTTTPKPQYTKNPNDRQFHINVLVPRDVLIGMSVTHGTITHNG